MEADDAFGEYVRQLQEAYGEDAVSVSNVSAEAGAQAEPSSLPAWLVAVTLVGTCDVTLAPSELCVTSADSSAGEEDGDVVEDAHARGPSSHSAERIRELTERYATLYAFRFSTVIDAGDAEMVRVSLAKIEDITLPAASVTTLSAEVQATLATFDHDAVAIVFALEAAQQSAQTLHEAEAAIALRAEARHARRTAARWRSLQPRQPSTLTLPRTLMLGRRCVYFHHIFCTHKRASMAAWCAELACFALCKIGYPGFLVLEGSETGCSEYVRRLQGLHWKHMEVRGEELVPVETDEALQKARRIPPRCADGPLTLDGRPCAADKWPLYVETTSAAEMGLWCQTCGLADLFRTGMRIYRSV